MLLEVNLVDKANDTSGNQYKEGGEEENGATTEAVQSAANNDGRNGVNASKASHHISDLLTFNDELSEVASEISLRKSTVDDGEDHKQEGRFSEHFEESNETSRHRHLFHFFHDTTRRSTQNKEAKDGNTCDRSENDEQFAHRAEFHFLALGRQNKGSNQVSCNLRNLEQSKELEMDQISVEELEKSGKRKSKLPIWNFHFSI